MRKISLLPVLALAPALAAQANTVAGLDGRLTVIDDMTYYGRRGPAYPNGEVGMAMLNTMCNPGSVNIPWFQAMQPDHPMFGFLVVRVAGDRIEQINEWSFCKHAFTSINVNGACGTCQNPGTGSLMGLNCSDTYAASNNASRTWLGPPSEINPWLGTWDPVGSYFDIGDPRQAGYPLPADGIRSLSQSIFDSVDNRVTIDEIDLTTPNAQYFYGLQLIHEGEALANRWDNLAHRGFNPTWNGSSWSFPNNAASQQYGSILERWAGSTVTSGSNGTDDGRFFVAVKTTSLGGGVYHYEYAIHNVDNSRAGGSFRIPVPAGANVTNLTFGDIDTDATNDWTVAVVGNEVVFTAPLTNPLEWNTIYNFGFDCDALPGLGDVHIDEARPGAGALWVDVQTTVPGGAAIAQFEPFGAGCDGSTEVPIPACAEFNVGGGTVNPTTSSLEYVYRVANSTSLQVLSFDIWTRSTGGTVQVPAHIYAASGSTPAATPIASTTITVGPNEGFYTATFAAPVNVSGVFYLGLDSSAQTVYPSNLFTGSGNLAYTRSSPTSPWAFQVVRPAYVVTCFSPTEYFRPTIGSSALPVLGTTYDVTLAGGLASSVAVLVSGSSNTVAGGVPLPAPLPGAPGCNLLVAPDALDAVLLGPAGEASSPITVPNLLSLSGAQFHHQWVVLDPAANLLGFTVSGGASVVCGL